MPNDTILEMVGIDKRFYGVHALKRLDFECKAGEVHVLMSENGAGKSTLLKILSGIYKADEGKILISGQQEEIRNPIDAKEKGLAIIHQELSMCKNMTIAENIFRGEEKLKGPLRFVDHMGMIEAAQEMLDNLDMDLRSDTKVSKLSIAQQQMVEIAGALAQSAKIVIMDESTASLTEKEIEALFKTIAQLKASGVCIIYVSHRLNETFALSS